MDELKGAILAGNNIYALTLVYFDPLKYLAPVIHAAPLTATWPQRN